MTRIKDRLPAGTIGYSRKKPDKKFIVIEKPPFVNDNSASNYESMRVNGWGWHRGFYNHRANRGVWVKEIETEKLHHILNPWQTYEWSGIAAANRGRGWECFDCKEIYYDQEHFLCSACRELQ